MTARDRGLGMLRQFERGHNPSVLNDNSVIVFNSRDGPTKYVCTTRSSGREMHTLERLYSYSKKCV